MIEVEIHAVDLRRIDVALWNRVRWISGAVAAALWIAAGLLAQTIDSAERALYMVGLLAVELFGALSATLMLAETDAPLVRRVTDWGAFVASVMVWFIGLTTDVWSGMTAGEGVLVALSVGAGFAWFVLAAISRPRVAR